MPEGSSGTTEGSAGDGATIPANGDGQANGGNPSSDGSALPSGVAAGAVDPEKLNMTTEQLYDYNKQLRAENAKRRVEAKKIKEQFATLTSEKAAMEEAQKQVAAKLAEFEKAQKEAELADKTEVEKYKALLSDANAEKEKTLSLIKAAEEKNAALQRKLQIADRNNEIKSLMANSGRTFSSAFEEAGFLAACNALDDKGQFVKSSDEIVLEVEQLTKAQRAKEVPATPQSPGTVPKGVAPPIEAEIAELLKITDSGQPLTPEQATRLSEISQLI